jgi:DNA-binding FrmR family transcriptional regulator
MAHVITDQEKLLRRTERLIGQVEAVKRSIEEGADTADVMHLLSASRGAINSLMAEVVEDHIREYLAATSRKRSVAESRAAEALIEVVKASLT